MGILATRKLPSLLASLRRNHTSHITPRLFPTPNVHTTSSRYTSRYPPSPTPANPQEFDLNRFIRQWELYRVRTALPNMSQKSFDEFDQRLNVLPTIELAQKSKETFRTKPISVMKEKHQLHGDEYQPHFELELHNLKPRFTLEPVTYPLSSRLKRRYGCHRILRVKVQWHPSPDRASPFEDPNFCCNPDLKSMKVGSIEYEFLYVHETSSNWAEAIFFATRGPGLKTVEIRDVLEWAIPLKENMAMTMAKYSARLDLSLSRTFSTVVLEENQIHRVEDVFSKTEGQTQSQCMTDGCSAVSKKVMQRIQETMKLDEMPSAFQGRIGSAKGVWYLASEAEEKHMLDQHGQDEWVQLSRSQIKYELHNPDRDQLTIDVSQVASPPGISALNQEFILVLHTGGVPYKTFLDMLEAAIYRKPRQLNSSDRDVVLRELQRPEGQGQEGESELLYKSSVKRCLDKLSAGSSVTEVKEEIVSIKRQYESVVFRNAIEKCRVEVPKSRTVMMIAPRTGNPLKEGEVFCNITTNDDETGMPVGILKGPVLLTRNPCLLRSDAIVVQAVDVQELRHLKNVVVMPNEGDAPMASKLAGGDYDGDRVFVTWDPRITHRFDESDVLPLDERVNDYFLRTETTVARVVGPEMDYSKIQEYLFEEFKQLYQGAAANQSSKTKKFPYTRLHGGYYSYQQLCSRARGADDSDAIFLAQIASRLFDARKSGEFISKDAYKSLKEYCTKFDGLKKELNGNYNKEDEDETYSGEEKGEEEIAEEENGHDDEHEDVVHKLRKYVENLNGVQPDGKFSKYK